MTRLDKFLCEMQAQSRSEVKELIRRGQVTINGEVIKRPEYKLNEMQDQVCANGRPVHYQKYVYLLLNKPAGIVSATRDSREETVLDWIRRKDADNPLLLRPLSPVGRLDKDTEGLLLLTDDGALAHRLLAPTKHVEKTYYVEIDGTLEEQQRKALETGVDIGEEKLTLPAVLRRAEDFHPHAADSQSAWLLTITEGKFHQVKRMMLTAGRTVTYLRRIRMGPLALDEEMETGSFRELTEEERSALGI